MAYTRNNIYSVVPSDIPGCTHLIMNNNPLTTLNANEFTPYPNMHTADLDDNQISTVSPTAFAGTILMYLFLSNNKLTTFPDVSAVGSTLDAFYIEYNPDLVSPDNTWFKSMTSELTVMRQLRLRGNQFSILPDVSEMGDTLREFVHRYNPIVDPDPTLWESVATSLTNLYWFSFGYSSITHWPDMTKIGDPNGIWLFQMGGHSDVNIRTEDVSVFTASGLVIWLNGSDIVSMPDLRSTNPSLYKLKMGYTQLTCDCSMKWLLEVHNGISVPPPLTVLDLVGATCARPSSLAGRDFTSLTFPEIDFCSRYILYIHSFENIEMVDNSIL